MLSFEIVRQSCRQFTDLNYAHVAGVAESIIRSIRIKGTVELIKHRFNIFAVVKDFLNYDLINVTRFLHKSTPRPLESPSKIFCP